MVDHFESVSQRLVRDPDDPLERPAQVQDRLYRPSNGKRTKKQRHRCGHVRGCEQAETHEEQAQPEHDHHQHRDRDSEHILLDQKPPQVRDIAGQCQGLRQEPALLLAMAFLCRQPVL